MTKNPFHIPALRRMTARDASFIVECLRFAQRTTTYQERADGILMDDTPGHPPLTDEEIDELVLLINLEDVYTTNSDL